MLKHIKKKRNQEILLLEHQCHTSTTLASSESSMT